jgi:hypothetical protein
LPHFNLLRCGAILLQDVHDLAHLQVVRSEGCLATLQLCTAVYVCCNVLLNGRNVFIENFTETFVK